MMYYSKVEICGVNTSKLPTLTEKEKTDLLLKSKEGDGNAREKLINGNLRLVLSIVQRFTARGDSPDDLFQVGCVGLIKAIDNFNTSLDVKFSTYAVPMIIGEIRRYLRDNNTIRVSRAVRDLAYRALNAREQLNRTTGSEPTIQQITSKIKENGYPCTPESVSAALEAIVEPVSLYDPVYNDGGSAETIYILDQVHDPDNHDDVWLENIAINEALKKLTEREKTIINKRYYNGKTQMEIASDLGISQAQVSRLEKTALLKIRKEL